MNSLPNCYITTQEEIDNMKSNSLIYINCEYCSTDFSIQKKAFTAQLKNKNTYRTTCSSSCFIKLKATDCKVITNCKTCNKEITKRKKEIEESKSGFVFCSKSCAAITNNSISKLKTGKNILNSYCCSQCNKTFTSTVNNLNKYITCSMPCWQEAEMKTKTMADVCKRSGSNTYDNIRKNARNYSKYIYLPKCALCGYDKHYEVCHLKALKDFSRNVTLYEVNNKTNLIHLCPNCHWEFDHNLIPIEVIIEAQSNNLINQ